MSKTPEEMAQEWYGIWHKEQDFIGPSLGTERAFVAGYQAAKQEYKVAIDTYNDVAKQMMEEAVRIMSPKDQLADASKVMCNTTMEEVKAVDTGELMPITILPTSAKWISVKERLPEEGAGWTMVYGCILSRWSVQPGFYDRQRKEWVSRFINGYEDEEGYARLESVTHWQPLPEPPKEEK